LPSKPSASHPVTLSSAHRLSAWRFPLLESGKWKVLPDGFGTWAFLVNFKQMKKQCSGANLRSWRHSRSQLQRVTIAGRIHGIDVPTTRELIARIEDRLRH
jgi:hypothetical protein